MASVGGLVLAALLGLGASSEPAAAAPASSCALSGSGPEGPTDLNFAQVPDATLEAAVIFADFSDHPAVGNENLPNAGFGQSLMDYAVDWLAENS